MTRARAGGLILVMCLAAASAPVAQRRPGAAPTAPTAISLSVILAIEDARAPTVSDLQVLIQATQQPDDFLKGVAIRALGRLERRDVITDLLPHLTPAATRAESATAIAQALRGAHLEGATIGSQEQAALEALIAAGVSEMSGKVQAGLNAIALSLGRLPYTTPAQVAAAEAFLRRILETPFPLSLDAPHAAAARGLESMARQHRKVHRIDEDTILRLRTLTRAAKSPEVQRNLLAALVAVQGLDHLTLQVVVKSPDMQVRRLAVLALAGAGSGAAASEDETIRWLSDLLTDTAPMVRIETIRAWVRRGVAAHGCDPLVARLADQNLHVVLAVLDALGDACRDDQNVTDRLTIETRTAPVLGNWQREAHAFVALAKRAPDRAALRLPHFSNHDRWQVRMYAARVAALLDDVQVLARLAEDRDDNVAETALGPLRRLTGADSDSTIVAALNRRNRIAGRTDARPYQVIRAAAIALERAESTPALTGALGDALSRISLEKCETSRDVRLALIARLAELGSPEQASVLTPLLEDMDPVVAMAAAGVLSRWTGDAVQPNLPLPLVRPVPPPEELLKPASVLVEMESGKRFEIRFNDQAPLARFRFVHLVNTGYYDGLTFHRIAPNFVIQGGSPNAHEYCGDCPFARDEGGAMNRRGSIGISTRGRDTGDSQIFINLVDNPRLDHEYTIFASVCQDATRDGMDVVDSIHEGDRMMRLRVTTPGPCR